MATHKEIMEDGGFTVVNKGFRYRDGNLLRIRDIDALQSLEVSESAEKADAEMKWAHCMIDRCLQTDFECLMKILRLAIGDTPVASMRAIGIGNFSISKSDSAIQMAVFERIRRMLNISSCFYQEVRISQGEKKYLEQKRINVLPADNLKHIPPILLRRSESRLNGKHIVYMIHFDHYGFNNVFESFSEAGMLRSLICIGNAIPIDLKSAMNSQLFDMKCVPLHFRGARSGVPEALKQWNRSFAHTCLYYFE
uniref:SRR1 domain-containing protein n=1 Tax=Bursaphelenchus xylophilus TaxID=6326 RepID=A0A1I7S3I3_BURXY